MDPVPGPALEELHLPSQATQLSEGDTFHSFLTLDVVTKHSKAPSRPESMTQKEGNHYGFMPGPGRLPLRVDHGILTTTQGR